MIQALSGTLHDLLLVGLETLSVLGLALFNKWKLLAIRYYTSKTTATQREWLRLVGVEAYHYAERAFLQADGPAKLNEAIKYVLDRAESFGVTVTYPEIRAVIEKAWSEAQTPKATNG